MAELHGLLAGELNDAGNVRSALEEARVRTWQLVEPLSDDDLRAAVTDFLSPPVWDLGHMANFEERWLVQFLLECPEMRAGYNDLYNAFLHARKDRPKLRLLDRSGVRQYMEDVRGRTLEVLANIEGNCDTKHLENYFVYWMLVLHEHQHQETLLQTIQLLGSDRYRPATLRPLPGPATPLEKGWILVPSGTFQMGAALDAGVYDNEAPPHTVEVPEFRIARYPVTVGEFLAFVDGGGYEDASIWSEAGQKWLHESGITAPGNWSKRPEGWIRHGLLGDDLVEDIGDEILVHVSYYEAEAYAKWLGARLPTEVEWERAARFTEGESRRNPWGSAPADPSKANIDQLGWGTSRIGSYPDGATTLGVEHMIGDVWEWTASGFEPYPDFAPFPYDEYSKVFFGGDYRVLRGGSWATRAGCATGTFRNWDHPYRRQIFAGIRLARDV